MELAIFIKKMSDAHAAQLFNVSERTASSWRRLERAPSPMQSQNIIDLTEGRVTWEGIYRPYVKYRRKQAQRLAAKQQP